MEELLEQLRSQHGDIYDYSDEEWGPVYFRRLKPLEFKSAKKDLEDETRKFIADEIIAKKVVVYPAPAEFEKICDRFPAIVSGIAGHVIQVAGAKKKDIKKL